MCAKLLAQSQAHSKYLISEFFFKILFIFREREREGERKGKKQQCVVASHATPIEDLAHSPACALTGN